MPRARDMNISEFGLQQMDLAAMERRRIRICGVVTATGDGYSGRYRNVWLQLRTGEVTTQVTASTSSELGTALIGSEVDLACTLTGIVDLANGVYFARQAQLMSAKAPGSRALDA